MAKAIQGRIGIWYQHMNAHIRLRHYHTFDSSWNGKKKNVGKDDRDTTEPRQRDAWWRSPEPKISSVAPAVMTPTGIFLQLSCRTQRDSASDDEKTHMLTHTRPFRCAQSIFFWKLSLYGIERLVKNWARSETKDTLLCSPITLFEYHHIDMHLYRSRICIWVATKCAWNSWNNQPIKM